MTIEHLSFGYSKRKNRVLNDCSLRLDEGKIYGLLGKNGVGKSTLLYLMTGLLTPTEGHACLNGTDVRLRRPDTLSDFFLIPEEFDLPDYNLKKYVRLNAPFYPHFDHENLLRNLEMFELPEDIKLGELSMGLHSFPTRRSSDLPRGSSWTNRPTDWTSPAKANSANSSSAK